MINKYDSLSDEDIFKLYKKDNNELMIEILYDRYKTYGVNCLKSWCELSPIMSCFVDECEVLFDEIFSSSIQHYDVKKGKFMQFLKINLRHNYTHFRVKQIRRKDPLNIAISLDKEINNEDMNLHNALGTYDTYMDNKKEIIKCLCMSSPGLECKRLRGKARRDYKIRYYAKLGYSIRQIAGLSDTSPATVWRILKSKKKNLVIDIKK